MLDITLNTTRFACAGALLALLAGCSASSSRYFVGEIELEINGETVRHSRTWKCEATTVFRPASDDLFERDFRQTPPPRESFVVKQLGSGAAVVFDNWMGCGVERRRAGDLSEVTIFDSASAPTYGERLYLRIGAPETVHNPVEKRFRVRLVKEGYTPLESHQYRARTDTATDEGAQLLSQLRAHAAYALTVDVITWNDVEKTGLRSGLALTREGWVADKFQAPPTVASSPTREHAPHDASLLPLPLGYRGADGKLSAPQPIRVRVGKTSLELDQQGFGELQRPEPDIKMARFYAEVRPNVWAAKCTVLPGPECPKPVVNAQ